MAVTKVSKKKEKKRKDKPPSVSPFAIGTHPKAAANERGVYKSYAHGMNKRAMDAAVKAVLVGADPVKAAQDIVPAIDIKRQTLSKHVKREKERLAALANGHKAGGEILAKFDWNHPRNEEEEPSSLSGRRRATTTKQFRDTLERIICARDRLNNGMSHVKAISMIADSHGIDQKRAATHYDYLV